MRAKCFRIHFIVVSLCLSASLSWAKEGLSEKGPLCNIQSIALKSFSQADVILVKTDRPVASWHDFTLENPKRLVIDLYNCDYQGTMRPEIGSGRFIDLLSFGRHANKIRIAANLREGVEVKRYFRKREHTLAIYIIRPETFFVKQTRTPQLGKPAQLPASLKAQKAPLPALVTGEVLKEEAPLSEEPQTEITVAEQEELLGPPERENQFGAELFGETSQDASSLELRGKFWNKYGHDTEEENRFEDDVYNHAEVQLEAKYVPNERVHAILSVDADDYAYRNDGDWDHDDHVSLYNAYINLSGSTFNVRVGNQMVKWGKTDEVSPLDNINPQDFRDGFVRSREERKVPIPMVNLELYKGLYKLQALYIPFFKKSEIDLVGRDWAFFDHFEQQIGSFEIEEEDYPKTLRNSEAGVRLSGTVANFDYALSYFHTRDDLPSLHSLILSPAFPLSLTSPTLKDLAEFARTTSQPIQLKYQRQSITGFEFETTWEDFGLRGDVAYVYEKAFLTNELQRIKKPVFEYVLGVDYNGPEFFYFNLQFSQAIVQNYDDKILFSEEITNTVNGEITKGVLYDNVELGFRYYYNITGEDYYYCPSILLKCWDDITFEFGAEIVGGQDNTLLGSFQDNDQVYGILEVRF